MSTTKEPVPQWRRDQLREEQMATMSIPQKASRTARTYAEFVDARLCWRKRIATTAIVPQQVAELEKSLARLRAAAERGNARGASGSLNTSITNLRHLVDGARATIDRLAKVKELIHPGRGLQVGELTKDLIAIHKQRGLTWNPRGGWKRVSTIIPNIILARGTHVVKLGDLEVSLIWDDNLEYPSWIVKQAAGNPVRKVNSYFHPHVDSSGRICTGEGKVALDAFTRSGNLYEAFDVVEGILRTYNDRSPHQGLQNWPRSLADGVAPTAVEVAAQVPVRSCGQCGVVDSDETSVSACDCGCGTDCCEECLRMCGGCGALVHCIEHCERCDNYRCWSCYDRDRGWCVSCRDEIDEESERAEAEAEEEDYDEEEPEEEEEEDESDGDGIREARRAITAALLDGTESLVEPARERSIADQSHPELHPDERVGATGWAE